MKSWTFWVSLATAFHFALSNNLISWIICATVTLDLYQTEIIFLLSNRNWGKETGNSPSRNITESKPKSLQVFAVWKFTTCQQCCFKLCTSCCISMRSHMNVFGVARSRCDTNEMHKNVTNFMENDGKACEFDVRLYQTYKEHFSGVMTNVLKNQYSFQHFSFILIPFLVFSTIVLLQHLSAHLKLWNI